VLWLYTLGFYTGIHHFIQDVVTAGVDTFNQGRHYWSTMVMLLTCLIMGLFVHDLVLYYRKLIKFLIYNFILIYIVMFSEVINAADVLPIIARYLTNRPSRKSMIR
jgi:hypothetical protein